MRLDREPLAARVGAAWLAASVACGDASAPALDLATTGASFDPIPTVSDPATTDTGERGSSSDGTGSTSTRPEAGTDESTGGTTGGGSGAGEEASTGSPEVWVEPVLLRQTGLYADLGADALAAEVRPFAPTYALWSDGAEKRRWIYLPPGARIDNRDERYWVYPSGTKLWKEFTRDGVRVETRLLEKRPDGTWFRMAFLWREDGSDADAVPDGVPDARGTAHDVPDAQACGGCHGGMVDEILSFTAIQLSHDADDPRAWTLRRLADEGRLFVAPAREYRVPGDATQRAALGYLHANCGHCHNPASKTPDPSVADFETWLDPLATSVGATGPYRTMVGVPSIGDPAARLVDPADPAASVTLVRMDTRNRTRQMPPLATEVVDEAGMASILDWIATL